MNTDHDTHEPTQPTPSARPSSQARRRTGLRIAALAGLALSAGAVSAAVAQPDAAIDVLAGADETNGSTCCITHPLR